MERVPEPELMEDPAQALAYHRADFSASHGRRVEIFRRCFPELVLQGPVLDLGCGSGDILLRFARAYPEVEFFGVDGSLAMLELARQDIEGDPQLARRVTLVRGTIPTAALPRRRWQLIMSHSLLHQLHRPEGLWQTVRAQAFGTTAVFMADLRRPPSFAEAQLIVGETATAEPDILQRDFLNSLCAAFEPEEVRRQLRRAGLPALRVETEPPSHLIVYGFANPPAPTLNGSAS